MSYKIYTRGQESSASFAFASDDKSELEKIIDQAEQDANRLLYKPKYLHLIILKCNGGKYEYRAFIAQSMDEFSAIVKGMPGDDAIAAEALLPENRAACVLFLGENNEYTARSITRGYSNMAIARLECIISEYTDNLITEIMKQEEGTDGQEEEAQ